MYHPNFQNSKRLYISISNVVNKVCTLEEKQQCFWFSTEKNYIVKIFFMNHAPVSLVKKIWGLQSLLYFLALTPNCGRRMASKKIKSLDVIIIWTTDCLQHIIFTTMSGRINVSRMMNCKCVKVGMVQHKRKTTKVPQHNIYIRFSRKRTSCTIVLSDIREGLISCL